jgi:hypothetical protein
MTIDELIGLLQAAKDAGAAGTLEVYVDVPGEVEYREIDGGEAFEDCFAIETED